MTNSRAEIRSITNETIEVLDQVLTNGFRAKERLMLSLHMDLVQRIEALERNRP